MTTETASLREELLGFVSSRLPDAATLTPDTDLLETDLLDSLLVMDVVAHVESTYGVRLGDADIAPRNFRTVAALADLVSERGR